MIGNTVKYDPGDPSFSAHARRFLLESGAIQQTIVRIEARYLSGNRRQKYKLNINCKSSIDMFTVCQKVVAMFDINYETSIGRSGRYQTQTQVRITFFYYITKTIKNFIVGVLYATCIILIVFIFLCAVIFTHLCKW